MKRSEMLRILARRLSNRDVEDIAEAAIDEMKFVQETVLQKLPNQPWFLEEEVVIPLPQGAKSIDLPEDYNGLMTHGGVWVAPAELEDDDDPCLMLINLEAGEAYPIDSQYVGAINDQASGIPFQTGDYVYVDPINFPDNEVPYCIAF
jgi:hypothetical protein